MWLQQSINELVGNDCLCFAASIWVQTRTTEPLSKCHQQLLSWHLPILTWRCAGLQRVTCDLEFILKSSQALRHPSKGSSHPTLCMGAVPQGTARRLAKLTSRTEESKDKAIDQLCPGHVLAL